MAFSGGVFTRLYSWVNDAATAIPITATRMDADSNDIAAGLSLCVTRDGQGVPTANIPWGNNKITGLAAGTTAGDSVRYEQATSAVAITGGAINSTPIGATTPSTGSFTTLQATSINSTPIGVTTPSTGAFTTLSASGNATIGTASGNYGAVVNGANSGTNGGASVIVQNAGAAVAAIGNYSNLIGGAYDATPTFYAQGSFKVYLNGTGTVGTFSSTGLSVTGALSATGNATIGNGATTASYSKFFNASGNSYVGVESSAGGSIISGTLPYAVVVAASGTQAIQFAPNATVAATLDTSGRLLVPNGTVVAPVAFASLPASPIAGQRAMINNSAAAPAFLSTAAGGGSTTVPVFYNGTTWLVG